MNKIQIMELVDELARLKHSQGMDDNSDFADRRRNAGSTGEEADEIRAAIEAALPDVPTVLERLAPDDAYVAGWVNAAKWADRTDLISDVGSSAFVKDRDSAFATLSAAPEPAQVSDKSSEEQPKAVQIDRTGCTAGTEEECTHMACATACPAKAAQQEQPRNEPVVQQEPVKKLDEVRAEFLSPFEKAAKDVQIASERTCIKARHSDALPSGTVVTRLELTDRANASLCANVGEIPSPQVQQPMSDEQFSKIKSRLAQQQGWDGDGWDLALKEAIEAFHKIGG